MFGTLSYAQIKETKIAKNAPLMCWDVANPNLAKQLRVAEDLHEIGLLKQKHDWQISLDFRALLADNYALVITDTDHTINWVSRSFWDLTGYEPFEVVGKRPSMLQGARTKERSRTHIREQLEKFHQVAIKLINYRKDEDIYQCYIEILPLKNSDGLITHYIALEKEVSQV